MMVSHVKNIGLFQLLGVCPAKGICLQKRNMSIDVNGKWILFKTTGFKANLFSDLALLRLKMMIVYCT